MKAPKRPFTKEEDDKLRQLWQTDMKIHEFCEFFDNRIASSLYDRGLKRLKLGARKITKGREFSPTWIRIEALLKKEGPLTSLQISEKLHVDKEHCRQLLSKRKGKEVYIFAYSTQCVKGGPSMIWALGNAKNAKKPKSHTRAEINARYKERLMKNDPEKIALWNKKNTIRKQIAAGTHVKRDIAASWF